MLLKHANGIVCWKRKRLISPITDAREFDKAFLSREHAESAHESLSLCPFGASLPPVGHQSSCKRMPRSVLRKTCHHCHIGHPFKFLNTNLFVRP